MVINAVCKTLSHKLGARSCLPSWLGKRAEPRFISRHCHAILPLIWNWESQEPTWPNRANCFQALLAPHLLLLGDHLLYSVPAYIRAAMIHNLDLSTSQRFVGHSDLRSSQSGADGAKGHFET